MTPPKLLISASSPPAPRSDRPRSPFDLAGGADAESPQAGLPADAGEDADAARQPGSDPQ